VLRTVKYGVSGALVAGLVGATVAWTNLAETVHLNVDGRTRVVETRADTVGELLSESGYRLDGHDIVAPAPSTPLKDGETVVLRRGRLLRLEVDGRQRQVWTTASTVADALAVLGYDTTDFVSVSRSRRLPLSPTAISVRTPKRLTLTHDGRTQPVVTTAATVGQLLAELSISLGRYDEVSSPTDAPVYDNEHLTVKRIVHATRTTDARIRFAVRTTSDPHLPLGRTTVARKGRPGVRRTTWAVVYVDGKLAARTRIGSRVVHRPVTQIDRRGTMLGPNATPGQLQRLAGSLLGKYGFGADQMGCLITIWNHESGWRVTARNPNGGAYGIPQALPGDKMAAAGPDWRINAETQIRWGLGYIKDRYGSPCGAWADWQAHGGWY
jgi:uncharacterized protein YabE (DUF348 family)